jgi:large subunit ribosomal protein L31
MATKKQPQYFISKVVCTTCGTEFEMGSIKKDIKVDICSNCHPFYSGKQVYVQATGQVEKFNKRYGIKRETEPTKEN